MNNLFLVVGGGIFVICLSVIIYNPARLPGVLAISLPSIVMAICTRFVLAPKVCYRVEVDTAAEKIRFFRYFNKEVVEAPIRSVEFLLGYRWACYYSGDKFIIFEPDMAQIADLLPQGMEIQFSEGYYGRVSKKRFERIRRNVRAANSCGM
ncbi:MAG: hypothetical protein ACLQDI_10640 [Syntrophobacteraceae bacterium]